MVHKYFLVRTVLVFRIARLFGVKLALNALNPHYFLVLLCVQVAYVALVSDEALCALSCASLKRDSLEIVARGLVEGSILLLVHLWGIYL